MTETETIYYFIKFTDQFPTLDVPKDLTIKRISYFQRSILDLIWHIPKKKVITRFLRGDHCYIALLDHNPVHFSWVQRRGNHFVLPSKKNLKIKREDIWIFHCRTIESARGNNIYPIVLQRIIQKELINFKRNAYIYTTKSNVASVKGIQKAGFTQLNINL